MLLRNHERWKWANLVCDGGSSRAETASAAIIIAVDARCLRVNCDCIPHERKGHRKGRAFPNGTVHRDVSSMALDNLGHNVESHTQAGDRSLAQIRDSIEAFKNLVELLARDTQAMITDTDRDQDRKSTRLNSSHQIISYAVFCLKKKKHHQSHRTH